MADVKARLLENWREEVQARRVYEALAAREPDGNRKRVLSELAEMERRHAADWLHRLRELGADAPGEETVRLPRSLELNLRFAPVDALIAHQEAEERRLSHEHAEPTGDEGTDLLLERIGAEDSVHADTLRSLLGESGKVGAVRAQRAWEDVLSREKWHRKGGGWVGDAIYGVNDGLAAVFGIVSGTSAAFSASHEGSHIVLIAGLAGAIASALSMGSGAYLATKSETEVWEAQIHSERQEVEEHPEEELEELVLLYQAKGLSEAEARTLADRTAQDPAALLKTMAVEELGLGDDPGGNPVSSGVIAGASTALGALIPVLPFFFIGGRTAVLLAAAISIIAHFLVGAAKSLLTIRSWWASGLEMTVAGIVVGVATYGVGLVLKVPGG